MSIHKHTLISIVGPTAIGKTSLSIELAKHFHTEIISSDSRQFYKEMSIGTAKPSIEEQDGITHHFIDCVSIHDEYTAGKFEKDALEKLDEIFKSHHIAIMVGGSGLYVNALINGIDDIPKDESIRNDLTKEFENNGITYLQDKLYQLDPEFYNEVNIQNPQRLIRAIEACIVSGRKYSELRLNSKKCRPFNILKIGLTAPRAKMYERINHRVEVMVQQGLVSEAESLYQFKELNSLNTVGYKELFKYFDGEWTLDFAIDKIKQHTRNFAKRQMTWFNKDIDIHWFDAFDDRFKIIPFIEKQLNHNS